MIDARTPFVPEPRRTALGHAVTPLIDRLALWCRNHRTRQQLCRLNVQQLADIGVAPADRAAECRKWFWQQ